MRETLDSLYNGIRESPVCQSIRVAHQLLGIVETLKVDQKG